MSNKEKAINFFNENYNCAQAILCAYSEDFGLTHDLAFKITFPFGGGIGKSANGLCGTVNAALIVIGLAFAHTDMDKEQRDKTNALIRNFQAKLLMHHESLICKNILKENNENNKMHSSKCEQFLSEVCDLLDEIIKGIER